MCNDKCNNQYEREQIFEILTEFDCLKNLIDKIQLNYKTKSFIGKITTLIAKSNEFIYYGGPPKYIQLNEKKIINGNFDVLNNFKEPKLSPNNSHYNYWLKCKKPHEIMPSLIKSHCLCFHCIKNLCFIKNKKTNKLYTIGIECINKFINTRRTCETCFKPHKNSKDNYCKECRILIKDKLKLGNTIIKFGKHYGKSIEFLINNDLGYVLWIIKQDKNKMFNDIIKYYNYIYES